MTMLLSHLNSRNQIGEFLSSLKLTDMAVEIGTHQGQYAHILLDSWPGTLLCVDPWQSLPGYQDQEKHLEGYSGNREDDYKLAMQSLHPFGNRVHLIRATSEQAAKALPDTQELDFVHIDGDHRYEQVYQDITLWWPKVKSRGIIAVHDFICAGPPTSPDNWGSQIQPAVLQHAHSLDLYVYLICEPDQLPWTCYFIKP